MLAYIHVLSVAAFGATPALHVFFDKKRYLFNCGEGTQRICTENRVRLSRLSRLFVGQLASRCIGGIPGLSLSYADIEEVQREQAASQGIALDPPPAGDVISLCGPRGLARYKQSLWPFVGARVSAYQCEEVTPDYVYEDECMTVRAVISRPNNSRSGNSEAVSWICQTAPIKGQFNPDAADALGVPPAKRGCLANGESVTLANGRIVRPEEVVAPAEPGPYFLVLECPSPDYIASLIAHPTIEPLLSSARDADLLAVVHFGPAAVIRDARYRDWIARFPASTIHLLLGNGACLPRYPLRASDLLQCHLNVIDPMVFPLPSNVAVELRTSEPTGRPSRNSSTDVDSDGTGPASGERIALRHRLADNPAADTAALREDELWPNAIRAAPMLRVRLLPTDRRIAERRASEHASKRRANHLKDTDTPLVDASNCAALELADSVMAVARQAIGSQTLLMGANSSPALDAPHCAWWSQYVLPALGARLPQRQREQQNAEPTAAWSAALPPNDAEVITLGTGSASPSPFRNVSGTLVRVRAPANGSSGGRDDAAHVAMLLDAGEATFGQIVHLFGHATAARIMGELCAIYISHMHADHHLGTATLIREHMRATAGAHPGGADGTGSREPLMIIGPPEMDAFLRQYSAVCEPLEYAFADGMRIAAWDLLERELPAVQRSRNKRGSPSARVRRDWGLNHAWAEWESHGYSLAHMVNRQAQQELQRFLQRRLGLRNLLQVPVDHCVRAFGCVLEHEAGWRLVYSGDTRPCARLQEAGRNATILVHEATFDDSMSSAAVQKMHSTVSDALSAGQAMSAELTIATHFSQRYPVMAAQARRPTVFALDFMTCRLSWIKHIAGLPSLVHAMVRTADLPAIALPPSEASP